MTTSRTTCTTPSTTSPASREPVADGKHPLSGSSSSPPSVGKFSEANAPVEPANEEGRLDNGQTKDGGSDTDANFTNEDSSSIGGGSVFGPPDLTDLILLNHLKCRVPTQITGKGGVKEPCTCGQLTSDCHRHARHHFSGRYCHVEGYYQRMTPGHGFQNHGKVCLFYTTDQVNALRQKELDEMTNLVGGLRDGGNTDEETDLYAPGVRFGETTTLTSDTRRTSPSPRPNPDHSVSLTAASLCGAFEKATRAPRKVLVDPLPLWYGLEDSAGKTLGLHQPHQSPEVSLLRGLPPDKWHL